MHRRRPASLLRAAALALLACAGAPAAPPATGTQQDLPAGELSPLSAGLEVARRTLTPLTFQAAQRALATRGQVLDDGVDPSRDSFAVYLPPGGPPPRGYGLLVFVAPWEEATRPRRWRPPLDRRALIFASTEGAGNETVNLERRLPMAVQAVAAVRARFPVDPERIYVGGMSGGSRAAEIAALAYPDLFRGALLNAGSEPIDGSNGVYIPPADLFRLFQRTRLVYATGDKDEEELRFDKVSRASMRRRCVLNVDTMTVRRVGHEPLDPDNLERALALLDRPSRPEPAELAACNAALDGEVAGRLAEAEKAIAAGERERARLLLKEIDARYGGLAAPAILELDARYARMP